MLKTFAAAATAALVAATASAHAADMYRAPAGGYKDEPYVAYPLWAGYYFGANLGGAWSHAAIDDVTGPIVRFSNDDSALVGGAQFGFLYQRGALVVGPEVDLGGIGFGHTSREPAGGVGAATNISSGFYGDLTLRLGYAFGQSLVYAKGGYVYFDGTLDINDGTKYSANGFSGYTVGGGLEYKFNPSWSVKGEYQYMDFGSLSATLPSTNSFNVNLEIQTAKLGLNYHIGGDYGPLK